MKLTLLTNPNPVTQEKMRFFADYFLFVNEFLGRLPDLPFDNPYSLTDKVKFQIENNTNHSSKYVPIYTKQLLSFYTSGSDKSEIKKLEPLYISLCSSDDRRQWLIDNGEFYIEIKRLHSEYQKNLFDENFASLFSFLKCKHNLKKHETSIRTSIQILVSQFRLNGYSKAHVDSCIGRILSHDDFPFPSSILRIKDIEQRTQAEKDFLKDRDLEKQFFGLKNLLERQDYQSGYFIYVIEGCTLESEITKDFKVEFEKVSFISPYHEDLKRFRLNLKKNDHASPFKTYPTFFGKNRLLAVVNLNYDTVEHSKETGLRMVRRELQQFNLYLNAELSLNDKHYLFSCELVTVDGGWLSGIKDKVTRIRRTDYDYLQKNAYSILRAVSGEAKQQILHDEDVFFKAISDGGMSGYWQYLENILWSAEIQKAKSHAKIAALFLRQTEDLRESFLQTINFLVHPFNFNYKEIGLTDDDLFINTGSKLKAWNKDFSILSVEQKIKSPFLLYAISYYKQFDLPSQKIKWREYFKSLSLELYDYRNSELHTGRVNAFTKIKLETIIPAIMNRARWTIIYACQKHQNLSFQELLKLLVSSDPI